MNQRQLNLTVLAVGLILPAILVYNSVSEKLEERKEESRLKRQELEVAESTRLRCESWAYAGRIYENYQQSLDTFISSLDDGVIQFADEDGFPLVINGEYYREIPQSEDSYRMPEMLLCVGPELVTMTNAEWADYTIKKALKIIDNLRKKGNSDE